VGLNPVTQIPLNETDGRRSRRRLFITGLSRLSKRAKSSAKTVRLGIFFAKTLVLKSGAIWPPGHGWFLLD
jgi:hypothetical protein